MTEVMPYPLETNPIGKDYHREFEQNLYPHPVDWADPRLARITRLRLLTDQGFPFWDVSYCHGVMKDGRTCRVQLPFDQLPRGPSKMTGAIFMHARAAGVYAKGLGILDAISTLR